MVIPAKKYTISKSPKFIEAVTYFPVFFKFTIGSRLTGITLVIPSGTSCNYSNVLTIAVTIATGFTFIKLVLKS